MSLSQVIRAVSALAAFILATLPGHPTGAYAENTALSLSLNQEPGRTRCAVIVENRPVFALKDLGQSGTQLLLMHTRGSDSFRKDVARNASFLGLDSGDTDLDTVIRFTLPGLLRELSAAWLDGEQALYLDFVHGEKGKEGHGNRSRESVLSKIRFGFVDMRTRMALTLGEGTPWELAQLSVDRARLRLSSVKTELEERRFGPANNLATAGLARDGETTDIDVRLLTRIDRVHLFWTPDGRHLVTDFFEGELLPERKGLELEAAVHGSINPSSIGEVTDSQDPVDDEVPLEDPGLGITKTVSGHGVDSEGQVVRGRIVRNENQTPSLVPEGHEKSEASDLKAITEDDLLGDMDPAEAMMYGRIRLAFEESDYESAAELCKDFQNRYPGSPMVERVAFLNGDAEFGLLERGDKDRFSSMMRAYQNAVSRFNQSPRVPRAHLNMARAGSMVGNNYAAAGYLNMVLNSSTDPETLASARIERGRVHLDLNRPDNAVEDFKAVLDKHPESPQALEARMGVARYYQALGLHDKALNTLERLADEHPLLHLDHPEFLFLRGTNALYVKQYDQARDFFFRGLNIGGQPEDADLLLARIGDTYHHASMPREAEIVYRAVIREYPDSEGAAIAKIRLAGYETGHRAFKELLEENPGKPLADLASLEMAKKLYVENKYTKVMEALEGLMERPFQDEIKREAEDIYFRSAEQEIKRLYKSGEAQALVDFYRSHRIRLQRNIDPEVVLLAGLSLQSLKRYSEAVAALEAIRAYDLSQVSKGQRLLAMAESLLMSREVGKALALLERKEDRALLTTADRHRLDYMLANLYLERGRSHDAYGLFQDLVRRERLLPDGQIASMYLNIGRIAARNGDLEEARSSLNRCIGIVEHSEQDRAVLREAYAELGTAYYLEGRYTNALDAFNRALEEGFSIEDKGFFEMRFNMAQAYLETGDPKRAEPILVELSEEEDDLLQQRARIRLGRLGLDRQLQRISLGSNGSP